MRIARAPKYPLIEQATQSIWRPSKVVGMFIHALDVQPPIGSWWGGHIRTCDTEDSI